MTTSISVALQRVPTIPDEVRALAAEHLSTEELSLVSSRANSKRLAEFVSGRVAARKAVARLLEGHSPSPQFRILREGTGPTGCPRVVTCAPGPAPRVSISHTDGTAIAAAACCRIGIDLATIEEHAASFCEEAFTTRELHNWTEWFRSKPTDALVTTTAFAAKEAALKWIGTGFGLPLHSTEILVEPDRQGHPARTDLPSQSFRAALITHWPEQQTWMLGGRLLLLGAQLALVLADNGSATCDDLSVHYGAIES